MRLFIAVNFSEQVKTQLCESIEALRQEAIGGNFTRRDNLHLTLAFLGETSRLETVKEAMHKVQGSPFILRLEGFGCFRRTGGNIYWIGVRKNEKLEHIQKELTDALKSAGFRMEERAFQPHLTLGRQVALPDHFDLEVLSSKFPVVESPVDRISLMKSERIGGRLIYTELFSQPLTVEC